MARIRTIKPEFFRHGDLYDLDKRTGLPVRLLYIALWTICDKEGRFRWRVREMRLDLMPYDSEREMETCLEALVEGGFVVKYEVEGEAYGHIPTFKRHQRIHGREGQEQAKHPGPLANKNQWELQEEKPPPSTDPVNGTHQGHTADTSRTTTSKSSDKPGSSRLKSRTTGTENGNGREGNGTRADARVSPSAFPDPGELAVMSVEQIHDLMVNATTEGELYALTGELKRRRGE